MIALTKKSKKRPKLPGLFEEVEAPALRPTRPKFGEPGYPFATPLRPGPEDLEPFPVRGPCCFNTWLKVLQLRIIRRCLNAEPAVDFYREWAAKWFEGHGCPVRAGFIREWLRHIRDSAELQTPTPNRFAKWARVKIDAAIFPAEAEHYFADIQRRRRGSARTVPAEVSAN